MNQMFQILVPLVFFLNKRVYPLVVVSFKVSLDSEKLKESKYEEEKRKKIKRNYFSYYFLYLLFSLKCFVGMIEEFT